MLISYIMWIISFIGDTLRRGERTWDDYWNQVLVKIFYYTMPAKEPPGTIRYRTEISNARKRLIILGLMAASDKHAGVPNIDLSGERILNMKLIKSRGKDRMLRICKLGDLELQQVIDVLENIPSALINKVDTKPIILAIGFSRSATGFRHGFLEGNLVQMYHTHVMGGICASLGAIHEENPHYEGINDEVKVSVL